MKYKNLSLNMACDLCNLYEIEIDELAQMYCLSDKYVKEYRKFMKGDIF